MKKFIITLCLLLPIHFLLISSLNAQDDEDDEPLYDKLTSTFQKDYLSIGTLLQVVGDFQPERSLSGNNGFSIANVRIKLSGELDRGFGYLLQTKFDRSPAILDASAYWKYSSSFTVKAGIFKSPFSYEFLTPASAIDFVNRSQVVSALAPARQIGIQVNGWIEKGRLSYAVGAFNGNRFGNNNNDNQHLLYTTRLAYYSDPNSPNNLVIGLNSAISEDENVTLPGISNGFDGSRFLIGTDARWQNDAIMLSGEFIYSSLDFDGGPSFNPFGFHGTAGYMLTPKTQILLRWDQLETDELGVDTEAIIAGINVWPTKISEVQVNYVIPTNRSIDHSQILLNFQIAF